VYWQVFQQAGMWSCLLGGPYRYGWHLCSVELEQEGCESPGLWDSSWAVNQFYPPILYLAALKQKLWERNWLNTISGQFGVTARVLFLYFYEYLFDVHVTVHRVKFLIIKPTRCTNFSNLFLEWNSTCFGQFLCPSSGVFHCEQDQDGTQFHPDPARKLSANLYDIYHCCVYGEKLLTMDGGTVWNM